MPRHKITSVSGKRRRKSPKKAHRRRRVGASGSKLQPILMDGLAVGVGIVGMRELSILAGQMFPTLMGSPVITGAAEIVVGGLLAWKSKNGFIRYAGLGGVGNGIMTVLNGAGVIGAGPQTMTYSFNRRGMGDPRLKFVAGPQTRIGSFPNNFSEVAGPGRVAKRRYTS